MGQWYAQTFAEYEDSELVAVCDLRRETAAEVAEKWGVPAVYADFREMLAAEDLEAVAVATPDRFHCDPVVACLEAGKHVLCEKPLATALEDAEAMKQAVERNGKELMVNFGNRRRPRTQAARKAVLEDRVVGEIANVYVELNERIGKTATLAWAADTSPVWFLLSHCVDTLRYVTGLEIVEIAGYETRKVLAKKGMPTSDTAMFVGALSNGGHVFLGSSWIFPEAYAPDIDFRIRVLGDKGLFEVQMHPQDMVVHADRTETVNYQYPYLDHRGHRDNWWAESTRYFVHCIGTGKHPTPDADDGMACLKVLLAMEQTAEGGQRVRID